MCGAGVGPLHVWYPRGRGFPPLSCRCVEHIPHRFGLWVRQKKSLQCVVCLCAYVLSALRVPLVHSEIKTTFAKTQPSCGGREGLFLGHHACGHTRSLLHELSKAQLNRNPRQTDHLPVPCAGVSLAISTSMGVPSPPSPPSRSPKRACTCSHESDLLSSAWRARWG